MTVPGLLVVDKPGGMTSHAVVSQVRKAMGTRKVGHAGTLDPMATGVLIVGVERATRLLGHLALRDKGYDATIRLGATTLTDDIEGELIASADLAVLSAVTDAQIHAGIQALTGDIEQVPTAISAIKVDGRRAHARVRAGETIELKPRPVTVTAFDLERIERRADAIDLAVHVECSTGTYVRALARDLGAALGTGGYLTRLRRTRVGPWTLDDATPLETVTGADDPQRFIISIDEVATRAFQTRVVTDAEADFIRHGRRIDWQGDTAIHALVDRAGHLLALAEMKGGQASYLAVFAA